MSDMIIISIEIICYILLSSLIRAHDACFNRADFISFTIETSAMNVSPTTSPGIRNFPTHFFSARKRHLNGKYTLSTDYCVNRTHGILTFIIGIIHSKSFYGERYEISSIEAGIMCSNKRGYRRAMMMITMSDILNMLPQRLVS